jgi:fucose permease
VSQDDESSRLAFRWSILLFALFVGAETTIGSWLFVYAERTAQFSSATAAYLVAVFWGAFTFGRLLAVFGSRIIKPTSYVSGSLAAGALLSASIMLLRGSNLLLWVAVAGLGLSMAAVFPQAFAFVSEKLGITGRRAAVLLLGGSLGGMLMPWLAGLMLDSVSAQILPVMVSLAMALALVAFRIVQRTAQETSSTS